MAEEFGQKLDKIQQNRVAQLIRCKCGHTVAETDNYCGLCGRQQLPVEGTEPCKTHTGSPSDKFCTTCGARKRL